MSDNLNTTIRYSDEDLAMFRALIEEKIKRAESDLNFYLESLSELNDTPDIKVKGLDDGSSSAEVERLTELANRQRKLLIHLDNALKRIDNKEYGVCRETGTLIPKERLMAVPHATLSIEAKLKRG